MPRGLNVGFRPSKEISFDADDADIEINLPHNVDLLGLAWHLAATFSVATGEDEVVQDGILRLVPRLGVASPMGQHYPDDFSLVQHAAIQRRTTEQPLVYDGPSGAGAQAQTEVEAEGFITFSPRFLAGGPADMHIPAISPDEVFQALGRWETEATNAASDEGTGALIRDTDGSNNAVTWDSEPVLTVTPIFATGLPQPYAIPKVVTSRTEGSFNQATTGMRLPIRTSLPILLAIVRALDDGSQENVADLITTVQSVGGRHDWSRVAPSVFGVLERMNVGGVGSDRPGELGIRFADGGRLGSAVYPDRDLNDKEILVDTGAPNGTARLEGIFFTAPTMQAQGITRANLARSARGQG